jgi:hypothetical protein
MAREQAALPERRALALDREEQAVQRRLAELDEVEAQLRQDFEGQERQLAGARRDLAALCARLRLRPQGLHASGGGQPDRAPSR